MNFENHSIEVYDYKDIMQILGIGKTKAYQLLNSNEFPIIRLGNHTKVSKIVFSNWLHKSDN